MKRLDPGKLSVEFRPGVTPTDPRVPRRYTLTHSDVTAQLFLTVAPEYAYDKLGSMRDEVLGDWTCADSTCALSIFLEVDGARPMEAWIRYTIFRRELPLALEAIRYGDREFFAAHPELDQAKIWMHFDSQHRRFNKVEGRGTPADYR